MCLILFSNNNHPHYKLILASNRDEFYDRPTEKAHWWGENKTILAGLDKKSNGTWLGVSGAGRLSAVTNFRAPTALKSNAPSRGVLVSGFLEAECTPSDYLDTIRDSGERYSGFNLLAGDMDSLYYYSNMNNQVGKIEPGYHGLCNSFLNTPWPKLKNGLSMFQRAVEGKKNIPVDEIFTILGDTTLPHDNSLPETGVGITWERILAPIFINSDVYGTRSSAIITVDHDSNLTFIERTFDKTGPDSFETETVEFSFRVD